MTETPTPNLPDDAVTLQSGARMPLIGFGTWQISGQEAVKATAAALKAGYRHLDTATVYGNEAEVGQALHDSGISRQEVFVTTKCPPDRAGNALDTLRESLKMLGTDYIDLWLIHWPGDGPDIAMWKEYVEARQSGLARDIGVSNYRVEMIDELVAATESSPAVNQIKWSPLLFDATTLDEHRTRSVVLEGYSALRGGTLDHPSIQRVAKDLGRTPAQVIIRWHLQHGVVVIPKSRSAERIASNADVAGFELSPDDMATLDGLGQKA